MPAKSRRWRSDKPRPFPRAKNFPVFKNNQIDLDALKVERDENDQRKEPTISEKVALAEAIAERLRPPGGTRQGQRTDKLQETFPEVDAGQTRDIAAAKAGLGSGKTLEAAQKVIERDIPELVEAMARVPPRSPMDRVPLDLSD